MIIDRNVPRKPRLVGGVKGHNLKMRIPCREAPPCGRGASLEAILKPRIRSESKAQADEKAQHTQEYVNILKRLATQLSGLRRGFEMASKNIY